MNLAQVSTAKEMDNPIPGYYDVALRDFGLFLGALALARSSTIFAE